MPTLYLHIGTPKTGTTAIQTFCLENREALAAKGYCFPIIPKDICDATLAHNGRFWTLANLNKDGSFESPEQEANWRRGIAYVFERFHEYPKVILSDEAIWRSIKAENVGLWEILKAVAESCGVQVRVIVYLRRQDFFISSYWAEKVKIYPQPRTEVTLGKLRFEDAIERVEAYVSADYYGQIEMIAKVFGRKAIDVRIYDRNRFVDGDIVPDFLNAVGLTMDPSFSLLNHEKNPSLSGNMLEIKRVLNKLLDFDPSIGSLFRELAESGCALDREQAPAPIYSEAERDAILKRYEESNRLLARDYFGDESAPLFSPPEPLPPKWTPDNPQMYETIILYFGLLAQRQQREIEELRSKFFLRRKLRRWKKTVRQRCKLPWVKLDGISN